MPIRLQKWVVYKRDTAIARLKRAVPLAMKQRLRRALGIRNAIVANAFAKTQMASPQIRDEYQRLVAANVAGVLLRVMSRFYGDLGIKDPAVPLVKALKSFRDSLSADVDQPRAQAPTALIRFEQAFAFSQAGKLSEALALYDSVFRDPSARAMAAFDPFVKEAVVRSGEFIGRNLDKSGDADAAIATYREILSIDREGLVARRLTVLLTRRGQWREAATYAETATTMSHNLFPHLPANNAYIVEFEREFLSK